MIRHLLKLLSLTAILLLAYQFSIFISIDKDLNQAEDKISKKQIPPLSDSRLSQSHSKGEIKQNHDLDYASLFAIACFAPGTDPALVEEYWNHKYANANSLNLSQSDLLNEYNLASRWSFTATDGGGLAPGDPTTLTWSYVDDGTPIGSGCGVPGESSDDSDVIAFFNGMYGPPTTPGDYTTAPWHNIFVEMFDSWSEICGLTFVYEPNDDGVAINSGSGLLGVRGDIRISGHEIDGDSGVLACNALPNFGDMIIDTADAFYTNNPGPANDPFLGLVNVLTHELGHGLGILHVCPVNETKLMEPFVSFAFEGQQEDDILAVNRAYGDPDEENDTALTATFLGDNPSPTLYSILQRSIDDNIDVDYYSLTVDGTSDLNITLTPTGTTYLEGEQFGVCSPGTDFNAQIVSDLMVELIDQDGLTVITTADSNGPGFTEGLLTTGTNPGTYFVRVQQQADAVNDVQMYNLNINIGLCTVASIPTNLQASSITGISAGISWNAQDFALFDLRYRESGTTTWINIDNIVPPNLTLSSLAENTEYEVQVRSGCPGDPETAYSSSLFFTTTGLVYCDSEGESVADEYISNVQFGTIDNTSADENGGYSDFTSISTSVVAGQDYPITITPTWTGNVFEEAYAVWIDFNQNENFEDTELVFSELPTTATTVTGIISIPSDATLGPTRMRVSMKYDGIPSSCESFDFGEVEDYTVDISDPSVGVEEQTFGAGFTLYPNPTNGGIFSIKTPNLNGKVNLEIFSLLGQQISVQELSVKGQQVDVNAQDLSTGIYVVKLSQGNQSFITKLIVE